MLIVDLTQNHSYSILADIDFCYNRQKVDECNFWDVFSGDMPLAPFNKSEGVPFWQNPCNFDLPCDMVAALKQVPIYLVDCSLTGVLSKWVILGEARRSEGLDEMIVFRRKQALTTLVILHELSHALMDPYLLGCRDKNSANMDLYGQKPYSLFYELKEERLANAMALKLIKEHVEAEEWDFVVDFVKSQPLQYALGLDYYNIYNSSMSGDWFIKKVNKKIAHRMAKEWIEYVTHERPLDLEQLKKLEALLYGDK